MQIEENHAKACSFIRAAASQGCSLVVLPEYHLTNWVPKDPSFFSLCKDWRKYLQAYQDLAAELKISIVPGTIVQVREGYEEALAATEAKVENPTHDKAHDREEPPSDPTAYRSDNRLENVAYFIGDSGRILGTYVKKVRIVP